MVESNEATEEEIHRGGENKCIEWLRYLKKTGGDNMHTDTLLQEVNT